MSQSNLTLIQHKVEHQLIQQRAEDGYVNATAMCKAVGKQMKNYLENQGTKLFVQELSRSVGIPTDLLIQIINTGLNEYRGTWVHPQIAINLAQWCSPVFAVRVSEFVSEWMKGNNPAQKIIQHWEFYLARTSLLYNSVPEGYFSVFHEAAPMIIAMIQTGVVVDDKTVPDISIGKAWSSYWKANLANTNIEPIFYNHYYPESSPQAASNPQKAKAYPEDVLPAFRKWLRGVYLPHKFPIYIDSKKKAGKIEAVTANKIIDAFSIKGIN